MREEIERALEKENLDRERSMAGEESASDDDTTSAGSVKSSAALMGDLEELRQKIEKYHARQDSEELADVRAKGEEVVSCYRYVRGAFSSVQLVRNPLLGHTLLLHLTAGSLLRRSRPQ